MKYIHQWVATSRLQDKLNLDGAKWAKAAKPFENKTNTLGYQGFTIDSKLSKERTKLTEL